MVSSTARGRARYLFLGLALVTLHASEAGAQSAQDDNERADAEFQAGRRLWDTDKVAACDHFEASMRLSPNATVLTRLGDCHAQQGTPRKALGDYRSALELNVRMNADRPDHQLALRQNIEQRIQALHAVAPHVTLDVQPRPIGLAVELDEQPVALSELDAPVLVDPGTTHRLSVRAPGYEPASATGTLRLSLTLTPVQSLNPAPVPAPPPRAPDSHTNVQAIAGYATLGVGTVTLGVAAYLGIRTLNLVAGAEPHCNSVDCEPAAYQDLQKAERTQTAGFIVAGAGLTLVVGGVVLVLTAPDHAAPARAQPRREAPGLALVLGPQGLGARGVW